MIDTIILKINNVLKYDFVLDHLNKAHLNEGKTYSRLDKTVLGEHFDPKLLELIDHSSTYRATRYVNKKYLPSSHYSMAYVIDSAKNSITFNFSIPKYLYGTNILQFVQHPTEIKAFDRSRAEDFNYNVKATFDRLTIFIKKFISQFNTEVLSVSGNVIEKRKVDPEDVEIERLDLAFNQYFLSKDEALKYLFTQKQVRKRYIRDTTNNKTDWHSSIYIKNDRYTAKIYHKGTEYKSKGGERRKHRAINRKANEAGIPEPFDTEFLQEEADRILRYEIEFSRAYMSLIYKNNLFRKDCQIHQRMAEISKKHRNLKERNKRAFEALKEAKNSEKEKALKERLNVTYKELKDFSDKEFTFVVPYTDGHDRRQYSFKYANVTKIYNDMTGQTCQMVLKARPYFEKYTRETIDMNIKKNEYVSLYKTTTFSRELLNEMFKVFADFIDQFTLQEKSSFSELEKRIDEHNKKVDMLTGKGKSELNFYNRLDIWQQEQNSGALIKVKKNNLKKILALMDVYTLDDMVRLKIIAKSTKYEILNKLKMLDYDGRHLTDVKIKTSTDFVSYFDMIFDHTDKFLLKNQYFK